MPIPYLFSRLWVDSGIHRDESSLFKLPQGERDVPTPVHPHFFRDSRAKRGRQSDCKNFEGIIS